MRNESGWEVWSHAVLGQFRFQELAMGDDGWHANEIAEHVYCRRIAGDDSTPTPLAVAIPPPARFDAEAHPSKRHTTLPCDARQFVVWAARFRPFLKPWHTWREATRSGR